MKLSKKWQDEPCTIHSPLFARILSCYFIPEGLVWFLKNLRRGDWLLSPANIKGANKDVKISIGRSTTVHNRLFWAHTLCTTYVTKLPHWLVPQSQVNNYCARSRSKKRTKTNKKRLCWTPQFTMARSSKHIHIPDRSSKLNFVIWFLSKPLKFLNHILSRE